MCPAVALATACLCAGADLTALPEHFRPDPFGAIVEPDQTAGAASAHETVLESALANFRATYSKDPAAAGQLLNVGESKVDKTIPAPELASWMLVSSAALNLDAVVNK